MNLAERLAHKYNQKGGSFNDILAAVDEALEEAARKCIKLYNTPGSELADEIRGMKSGSQ